MKSLPEGAGLCLAQGQGSCGTELLRLRNRLQHEGRMQPFKQEAVEKRARVASRAVSLRSECPAVSATAPYLCCTAAGVRETGHADPAMQDFWGCGRAGDACISKTRPPEIRQKPEKRSGRLAGSSSPPVPPIRPGNQSVVCCEAPESAGKRDTVSRTCRLSGSCCGIGAHLRRARLQGSALLHLALRRRCIALSRRPLREGARPPVRGLVFLVIRLRLSASAAGAPAAP